MSTKPTKDADWATTATGIAATTEPSSGKKGDGWADGEQPPHTYFNWWFNLVGTWLDYLRDAVFTTSTTNGDCVTATGNGTGAGVKGTGGSSDGTGVSGVGGATNGKGVNGQGTGTGSGVNGVGGSTGQGATFTGGSGGGGQRGLTATAGGAGAAGVGAVGVSGGPGLRAVSDATNVDVVLCEGYQNMNAGSKPATSDDCHNKLTKQNMVKVWAVFDLATGAAPTLKDGFHLHATPTANAAGLYTLTFKTAFANAFYFIGLQDELWGSIAGATGARIRVQTVNAGSIVFEVYDGTDVSTVNEAHFNGRRFGILLVGAQ